MSSGPAPPASYRPLQGKVALITGSSRGMGREFALHLASLGASIVVNHSSSSSRAGAEAVVAEIERAHHVHATAIQADVSQPEEIVTLFARAIDEFVRPHFQRRQLDIVVSNAGVEHFGPLESVTAADFDRVFAVNTRGQFLVAQQASRYLVDGGRLVLMSSVSAQARTVADHAVYSGSKAAVEAFARCFAKDFGPRRITVNAIAPGGVKTDMYASVAKKYVPRAEEEHLSAERVDEAMSKMSPLDRPGYPNDVSPVVAFLVSEEGGWINGQVINISGGAFI
ncbi:MAG: hypothetical protein M1826_004460 [Phylliscum demangeonii]|nr:MAG: hypothetical protein M1826_004460 [Phylliscum demangeonii]